MDEQRPYGMNEPHFSPLPDEDLAWEKMKAKLDEQEERRRFVLPPFLTGCGGWALLLLLLAGGGLWLFTSFFNEEDKRPPTMQVNQKDTALPIPPAYTSAETKKAVKEAKPIEPNERPAKEGTVKSNETTVKHADETTTPQATASDKAVAKGTSKQSGSPKHQASKIASRKSKKSALVIKGKTDVLQDTSIDVHTTATGVFKQSKDSFERLDNANSIDTTLLTKDSIAVEAKPTDTIQTEKAKRKDSRFVVAAGLALQQQLPFGGQQWTPYNYMGRQGSLADYIPSVYVRLYKNEKWFLQSGFRYGAPQYSKEFVYTQNLKLDSIGQLQSTTAYRLKKTYYHQLPLSFHYRVQPQWSVGVGAVYNKFFGAISEKEERRQLTPTTDTLISKALVRDRSDSFFRSHNFQLLLETTYRWKRFSTGVQYTQGLQPFIEYTNAQGQKQRQRNYAINVFVRYELWRSKK